MTNVTPAAAFSTLAPFEIGSADYAVLKAAAVTAASYTAQNMPAASTSNNVACVSCHRAHASGFECGLRFFYLNEFMTVADAANAAIYDSAHGEQDQRRLQPGPAAERVQRPPGHRVRPVRPQPVQQVPREGLVSRHG